MKRKLAAALTALTVFMSVPVIAQDITVNVNGSTVSFEDAQPVIIDGRTMVPLRGVFEQLGYTINWDAETKTAALVSDTNEISVTVGSNVFYSNNASKMTDVPAQIINGRMYLPLRAIGEAADMNVSWDSENKVAYIEELLEDITMSDDELKTFVKEYLSASVIVPVAEGYAELESDEEKAEYLTIVNKYIESMDGILDADMLGSLSSAVNGDSANTETALADIAETLSTKAFELSSLGEQLMTVGSEEFITQINEATEKAGNEVSENMDMETLLTDPVGYIKKLAVAMQTEFAAVEATNENERKVKLVCTELFDYIAKYVDALSESDIMEYISIAGLF